MIYYKMELSHETHISMIKKYVSKLKSSYYKVKYIIFCINHLITTYRRNLIDL
jgi:hypothetical protein